MATKDKPTTRKRTKSAQPGAIEKAENAGKRAGFRTAVQQQKDMDKAEGRYPGDRDAPPSVSARERARKTASNTRDRGPNRASNPGRMSTPAKDTKPRGTGNPKVKFRSFSQEPKPRKAKRGDK